MAASRGPVHPKVQAAGAVGAFTTLVVFVAAEFGLVLPPEVSAAVATLAAFAAGYLQPGR